MKKYLPSLALLAVFETVAVVLWLTKDNLFYLFNFSYIGGSIALGTALFVGKYKHARRVTQLLVGSYMLVYLGLICRENMQIERASGTTCSPACSLPPPPSTTPWPRSSAPCSSAGAGAGTPAGRPWCWTLLPYKRAPEPPAEAHRLAALRDASRCRWPFVGGAVPGQCAGHLERIMFWAFVVGNAAVSTGLGIACWPLRLEGQPRLLQVPLPGDGVPEAHELFCPGPDHLRSRANASPAAGAGRVCPMEVDMTGSTSRRRTNGTECILCMECVKNCPKGAL